MEVDIADIFGNREAESVGGSGSEAESDGEGHNNPMEVQEPGQEDPAGQEEKPEEAQTIKPKKVVKNPQPKLDIHRLVGPRGIFSLLKMYKNFKFKGKGHEREDLRELLRGMEHWAHRLYPKLPFKDTLEQIEKLGAQKNVQVQMTKLRLDMFVEEEGEDNVRRGTDQDDAVPIPTIDVFDELLGNTVPAQSTTVATHHTTVIPQSTIIPTQPSTHPIQTTVTLTDEQRERMERNRKLAIEKRLARIREQQQQQYQEQVQQQEEGTAEQPKEGTPQKQEETSQETEEGIPQQREEETSQEPEEGTPHQHWEETPHQQEEETPHQQEEETSQQHEEGMTQQPKLITSQDQEMDDFDMMLQTSEAVASPTKSQEPAGDTEVYSHGNSLTQEARLMKSSLPSP